MSSVERFVVLHPYLGESTIGGPSVSYVLAETYTFLD